MTPAIRRTRQVRDDLIAIYRHIHDRNPVAADRVFDAIQRSVRDLLDAPSAGRLWNSPDRRLDGLRVAVVRPYRNYLIFYRPAPHGIDVFRILHGARELGPLLDEIDPIFDDDDA